MFVVKRVRDGWAVFSNGFRITRAMPKRRAIQIRKHFASEID